MFHSEGGDDSCRDGSMKGEGHGDAAAWDVLLLPSSGKVGKSFIAVVLTAVGYAA